MRVICARRRCEETSLLSNTSVHSSSPASTSIFGLAEGLSLLLGPCDVGHRDVRGARGPLAPPRAAAAMLNYRFNKLGAAGRTAQLAGRRGLQFPWESGMSTGHAAAPLPGTASWHADHVTLDVAISRLGGPSPRVVRDRSFMPGPFPFLPTQGSIVRPRALDQRTMPGNLQKDEATRGKAA